MRRRLWTWLTGVVAVASLLLAVGAAGMWVRSYGTLDAAWRTGDRREDGFLSGGGAVAWHWVGRRADESPYVHYTSPNLPGHWEPGTWPRATPGTPVVLPAYPVKGDPGVTTRWRFAGVAYARSEGHSPVTAGSGPTPFSITSSEVIIYFPSSRVEAPYALLVAAFAAGPVAWAVGWRRRRVVRRRVAGGRCAACGYDLLATPEAGAALLGRCPECGRDR
jgi:hypothetical protein